jgi:hypothetical protein
VIAASTPVAKPTPRELAIVRALGLLEHFAPHAKRNELMARLTAERGVAVVVSRPEGYALSCAVALKWHGRGAAVFSAGANAIDAFIHFAVEKYVVTGLGRWLRMDRRVVVCTGDDLIFGTLGFGCFDLDVLEPIRALPPAPAVLA